MEPSAFEQLNPNHAILWLEEALQIPLETFARPCNSHINRVYEMTTRDGIQFFAKFYRPGRWSVEAIREEHEFLLDCDESGLPVSVPAAFDSGDTISVNDGIPFAAFPKISGRPLDPSGLGHWRKLGSLLARVHNAGELQKAPSRGTLLPNRQTRKDLDYIAQFAQIPKSKEAEFLNLAEQALKICEKAFERNPKIQRIHGDCHRQNIIVDEDGTISLIDFDDMLNGPPVQDLWMLLPDKPENCRDLIGDFIDGYRDFRSFSQRDLNLIEPLRVMRMLYFIAWCARQKSDYCFKTKFPEWDTEEYWVEQIEAFRLQLERLNGPIRF